MTITSQPSLSSLSTSIQQFLQAINEYGVSFDDLNSLIGTKSNNLIAIMDNIDAKTTGATTIYTVPSGKRLVITNVFIIPETITSFSSTFALSIGTNSSNYDNLFEIKSMLGLDTLSKFWQFNNLSGLSVINEASDIIKCKITTGATATTYKIKVLLFGYFL